MRATLVQLGHTAHRVPSTDAFAVGSSQCPSAAAGSHSFRVCCAVDAFIALGGRSDKSGEISTEKLRAVIKDFGLTIDIDVSAAVLAPQACSRCLFPDSQTRPCCRIAAPDSRHGHGSLRIDRLRGVQTDDGGQEEVKCGLTLVTTPINFVGIRVLLLPLIVTSSASRIYVKYVNNIFGCCQKPPQTRGNNTRPPPPVRPSTYDVGRGGRRSGRPPASWSCSTTHNPLGRRAQDQKKVKNQGPTSRIKSY